MLHSLTLLAHFPVVGFYISCSLLQKESSLMIVSKTLDYGHSRMPLVILQLYILSIKVIFCFSLGKPSLQSQVCMQISDTGRPKDTHKSLATITISIQSSLFPLIQYLP